MARSQPGRFWWFVFCVWQRGGAEPMREQEAQAPRVCGVDAVDPVERFALPKSGGALGQYMRSGVGRRLRFLQRMLYLSGDWCDDVAELEYTVNVTVSGERATVSVLDLGCEVELRVCESHGMSELGLGAEDVRSAVIGMLGVSREEFDEALELQGFGENGGNVLIRGRMMAAKKEMKNNKPRYEKRALKLRRSKMCDVCGGAAATYTVKVSVKGREMKLRVCKRPCTEEANPVVDVLGESVRICRDLRMHKAVGIVMVGGSLALSMGVSPPYPPRENPERSIDLPPWG